MLVNTEPNAAARWLSRFLKEGGSASTKDGELWLGTPMPPSAEILALLDQVREGEPLRAEVTSAAITMIGRKGSTYRAAGAA